ncbi:Sodium/potassium-transporting ATPase subunit beta-2 [Bienertia sinuspersici]
MHVKPKPLKLQTHSHPLLQSHFAQNPFSISHPHNPILHQFASTTTKSTTFTLLSQRQSSLPLGFLPPFFTAVMVVEMEVIHEGCPRKF